MKWILHLLLFIVCINPAIANELTIKEETSADYRLWKCEELDIAKPIFHSIFQKSRKMKSVHTAYISSFFIHYTKQCAGYTTVRLVDQNKKTLFFSVSLYEALYSDNQTKANNADVKKVFSACFQDSFNAWQQYRPKRNAASIDDIAKWIEYPEPNVRFSERLMHLIIIERLSNQVPESFYRKNKLYLVRTALWDRHKLGLGKKLTFRPDVQSGLHKVTLELTIALLIKGGVVTDSLSSSSEEWMSASASYDIDTSIYAINDLCKALLGRIHSS